MSKTSQLAQIHSIYIYIENLSGLKVFLEKSHPVVLTVFWYCSCWAGILFGDPVKSEFKVRKEWQGITAALQVAENKEEQREKEVN